MTFKDFFYYMYYRIYCLGVYLSDDILNNLKPFFIFTFLYVSIFMGIWFWYCLFTSTRTYISNPIIVMIVGIPFFIIIDYFIFTQNQRWKRESKKFKSMKKKQRMFWDSIILIVIILILSSLALSLNEVDKAGLRGKK